MKIVVTTLIVIIIIKFSAAQSFCDSAYNPCDSVAITSVQFINDEVYGDKLIFSIQTNHANLYAPNFIICPDDEEITFEDPNYGFFSIFGPSEVQLLYYFSDFDFTGTTEPTGRIINDNSNNEFSKCEMSFDVLINGPDAIFDKDEEITILLFPNPSNNEIFITSMDVSNPIKNVVFMNLSGKRFNVQEKGSIYDLANLSAGIYFIEIELQNGSFLKKKILKS